MIVCDPIDLSVREADALKAWLSQNEADRFLTCLKAEHAELQCKGLEVIDQQAPSISRGEPLPESATSFLRQAAAFSLAIRILEERITGKKPLFTVKPAIS